MPTNHLYRNNHDGTFTDVTGKPAWQQPAGDRAFASATTTTMAGKILYVTYYGKNRLYHNDHGVFTDVTDKAGVAGTGKAWGSGCAFVDYDRDGQLDLIVANYVDFDLSTAPAPGDRPSCIWKGAPVMCGPRGLPAAKNILYHNRGDGTFEDVTTKAHIDQTDGHYALSVSTLDYDDDGWPDIYVACDSTASILYHNNHDGTFTDVAIDRRSGIQRRWPRAGGHGLDRRRLRRRWPTRHLQDQFFRRHLHALAITANGTFDRCNVRRGTGPAHQYLGWGTMFFDFDNDGWPDLLLVNGHVYPEVDKHHLGSNFQEPRMLYHNNGNGTFTDISASAGTGITTRSVVARAGHRRPLERRPTVGRHQ